MEALRLELKIKTYDKAIATSANEVSKVNNNNKHHQIVTIAWFLHVVIILWGCNSICQQLAVYLGMLHAHTCLPTSATPLKCHCAKHCF